MRSLATGTIVLLLLSLFGSHPCSCEIREKLAAASEPADSHSCCHSAEPEQEQQERHACIGCESCGAETGTPPGCGGNITEPERIREVFAGRIAMIGGIDQFNVLTEGSPGQIRETVHRLFDGFGRDGGYIMSACDHFFETPVDNLVVFADAARECRY